MNVLDRIERRIGRFAVPNLTLYIIAGEVAFYLLVMGRVWPVEAMALIPERVLAGEPWRLVTFLFMPPVTNPIFAFFGWYLFWIMGTALESQWGTFRYNLFLLVGCVATVAVAFVTPSAAASSVFIGGSVFLAFAFLHPDFVIYILFILPVRIKWLALITWLVYGAQLAMGAWSTRLVVLAAVCNFLLFFGRDIVGRMRTARRHMGRQASLLTRKVEPRHVCAACGLTDLAAPDMDFRYCTGCVPAACYCRDHIGGHAHVGKGSATSIDPVRPA